MATWRPSESSAQEAVPALHLEFTPSSCVFVYTQIEENGDGAYRVLLICYRGSCSFEKEGREIVLPAGLGLRVTGVAGDVDPGGELENQFYAPTPAFPFLVAS